MTRPAPPDPESLLAHDVWLRRLCASLVEGEATGTDVAQETLVAALRGRPPREAGALRAWLAGVARNVARSTRRAETRRRRREELVARPEALPASDDLVAEVELRRRVTEALARLDVPLQRALALRFFHDCTLPEIARREDVAVSTAHARVERGLELLRRELDRGHAGRRDAWAGAALALAGRAPVRTLEVLTMSSWMKTLAVATLLAIALVAGWQWSARESDVDGGTRPLADDAVELGRSEAPAPEAPGSGMPMPDHASGGDEGAARRAGGLGATPRELDLLIVREPGDTPLAFLAFEVTEGVTSRRPPWPMTDAEGRAQLVLPSDLRTLSVAASGYTPGEQAFAEGDREVTVRLRPLAAIFGRVLQPDGAPAAGANVAFAQLRRSLLYSEAITRARPEVTVQETWFGDITAVTDSSGRFCLPLGPAAVIGPARLEARDAGRSRVVQIDLTRVDERKDIGDLVLADPERLVVRVRDDDGRPVQGAEVGAYGVGVLGVTGDEGQVVCEDPLLPAHFFAREPRHRVVAVHVGGVAVGARSPRITSCGEAVEFVLTRVPTGRVQVLDAETRLPLWLGGGEVELVRDGVNVGSTSFQPDRQGMATLVLRPADDDAAAPLPERARVTFDQEGYRDDQVFELDTRDLAGDTPTVLLVEAAQGYRRLTGRVVRNGVPVPDLQIGLAATEVAPAGPYPTQQYQRAVSDADGRFSLRWRDAPGLAITVHPHWKQWQEYGFIGPLTAEEAEAQEHVLELEPARRVPVVLRGVQAQLEYRYYVEILGEVAGREIAIGTTVNGAPLEVRGAGVARTSILLPARQRALVRLGMIDRGRIIESERAVARYDPSRPTAHLELDVEPWTATLSGRVAGVPATELGRFVVAANSVVTPVGPDGAYSLRVLHGNTEVLLLRRNEGMESLVAVARVVVQVDDDIEGMTLVPDTESLPVEAREW